MGILDEIVSHKRSEIKELKKEFGKLTKDSRPREVIPFPPDHPFLIAEIKAASPSAGKIREIDPIEMAQLYIRGGADAISVVVDRKYFSGNPCWVREIALRTEIPILFKEFVVDEWQVEMAYSLGADIVLLIATALNEKELEKLHDAVNSLGMKALVEAHTKEDIEKALSIDPVMIGINNRDLKTFRVDISTTINLIDHIPQGITVVSESGIEKTEDIRLLREKGVMGFLVGTSILKSENLEEKVRELKNAVVD